MPLRLACVRLSDQEYQALEAAASRFEEAWKGGPPDLTKFVDANSSPVVVAELIHIDLECRFKARMDAWVESYVATFPQIESDADLLADLVTAEFRLRRRRQPNLSAETLAERFPHLRDKLIACLKAKSPTDDNSAQVLTVTFGNEETPSRSDGRQLSHADVNCLPNPFGRYRLIKKLGHGGMGMVFLAHDNELDRDVALKVPFESDWSDPEIRRRFLVEARAAAVLRHANICPTYDVGQHLGTPYLTMAYISGETLAARLRQQSGFTQVESARLVRQLALALHEAHACGIIHRDLKSANVMIDHRGEPILMDFGLARRLEAQNVHATSMGRMVGTPSYMSPEQVEGDSAAIGPASDMFSLGVILYELLTGQLPFRGSLGQVFKQILNATPAAPSSIRPEVHQDLEAICLKAMARIAKARYPSMRELADALADWEEANAASAKRPAAAASEKRHRLFVGGAVAFGLLLVAGIAAAAFLLRVETPRGTLVVQCEDPEVELVVKGHGVTLRTHAGEYRLAVGEYTIEFADPKQGLKLQTDRFTIGKDGKESVKAWIEKPAVTPNLPVIVKQIPKEHDFPEDPHRTAAVWLLENRGNVYLEDPAVNNWRGRRVTSIAMLPRDPFKVQMMEGGIDGRRALQLAGALGELRIVWMDGRQLEDDDLQPLLKLSRLRTLNVWDNPLTDKCAATIRQVKGLGGLCIGATRMTDRSLEQIALAPEVYSLFANNLPGVTDKGMDFIRTMSKLTDLNLENTKVTDEGLAKLHGMKTLRKIWTRGSKISHDGLRKLHDILPECWIDGNGGMIEPTIGAKDSIPKNNFD